MILVTRVTQLRMVFFPLPRQAVYGFIFDTATSRASDDTKTSFHFSVHLHLSLPGSILQTGVLEVSGKMATGSTKHTILAEKVLLSHLVHILFLERIVGGPRWIAFQMLDEL